jgi:hypothetical protein
MFVTTAMSPSLFESGYKNARKMTAAVSERRGSSAPAKGRGYEMAARGPSPPRKLLSA